MDSMSLDSRDVSPRPDDSPSQGVELAAVALVSTMLRHRRLIASCVTAAVALLALLALREPRGFVSSGSFMVQSRQAKANLSGLAAQFGVTLPTDDGSQSPQFYVDLMRSREILRQAVRSQYAVSGSPGVTTTLVDVLGGDVEDARMREAAAIAALRDRVSASVAAKTGVIHFAVEAPDAGLAQAVANRLFALVNQFNLESRRSQAAQERGFIEQRMADAGAELEQAENRLQLFLQHNREFASAPALRFQQDRLARDVGLRQQVYGSLAQSFEQAKIEEVRDTPAITVIEPPEMPLTPKPRGLVRNVLLGLAIGGTVGVLLALLLESLRSWPRAHRRFLTASADRPGPARGARG